MLTRRASGRNGMIVEALPDVDLPPIGGQGGREAGHHDEP
jgi:hypothetical protein